MWCFTQRRRRLLPVLLWQIGLHLKENVLPLFYQVLGLLDGLLLFGIHVGFASGGKKTGAGIGIASVTQTARAGTPYRTVSDRDTSRTGKTDRRQGHDSICRVSSSVSGWDVAQEKEAGMGGR